MNARAIWAVVPVKPFGLAKQRLAPVLAPEARARLAEAMLRDVLAALAGVQGLEGVLVVSAEPRAGEIAADHGAEVLVESEAAGLNEALERAAACLAGRGAGGMLVLPGDVPGVLATEVAKVLALHDAAPALTLVAAHDGEGTNALLASPPGLIRFAFGPGSLGAHLGAAALAGVEPAVLAGGAVPGIAHDIDSPEDLWRLALLPPETCGRQLALGEGVPGFQR